MSGIDPNGIGPSGTRFGGIDSNGIEPNGIGPGGLGPGVIEPTSVDPPGVDLPGIDPGGSGRDGFGRGGSGRGGSGRGGSGRGGSGPDGSGGDGIEWPAAELSTVVRARALAASIPGAGYGEVTMDVPFADAWRRLADLERSVAGGDPLIRSVRIRSRRPVGGPVGSPVDGSDGGPVDGSVGGAEELRITVRARPGLVLPMTARLEEGMCLMQAPGRLYVVVMAAAPEPGDPTRTRYAHLEAIPGRRGRPFRRLLDLMVRNDVDGFRRYVEG